MSGFRFPPSLLPRDWLHLDLALVARLAPVRLVPWRLLNSRGVQLAMKREDLLDPHLGGNKFYKLHSHLLRFMSAYPHPTQVRLLSFGGAYSNHLFALAAAGQALGVGTVGVIRGERPSRLSETLQDLLVMGMELVFLSRAEYQRKNDPLWLAQLRNQHGEVFVIPEGGGDEYGAEGCAVWAQAAVDMAPWRPDVICLASATGASAAGVLAGGGVPVQATLVLKGGAAEVGQTQQKILVWAANLAPSSASGAGQLPALQLESNYHCGGYARFPAELRRFVAEFEQETAIPLDPVYTAKLMWGIARQAEAGVWQPGTKILALHTGGLQGWRGYEPG